MKYSLKLAYLYPKSMNIYGDRGNVLTLSQRCQWRDIKLQVEELEVGDRFDPQAFDLVFAGGGQDRHQFRIADDLKKKQSALREAVNSLTVCLLVCGTYQLFGKHFKTASHTLIPGIDILSIETIASSQRKIGNIAIRLTEEFGIEPRTVVGFENHSGNTMILDNQHTKPLGQVINGFGNNGLDHQEGAYYKHCFGTYCHGSLLPKNPHFADYLLRLALKRKYSEEVYLKPLPDQLEWQAHTFILKKRNKKS